MQGEAVMRDQTKHFIDEDPTDIILTRNVKQEDGAGGYILTDPALQPVQTFKVTQAVSAQDTERRTVAGEVVIPSIALVCEWDANIEIGDTFNWNDLLVEVVWLVRLPYVVTAEVAVR